MRMYTYFLVRMCRHGAYVQAHILVRMCRLDMKASRLRTEVRGSNHPDWGLPNLEELQVRIDEEDEN